VVEFGSGRREKGVRFAEREGRGERKKCALHFVDATTQLFELRVSLGSFLSSLQRNG